jgi:hypothetical protein
MKLTIHLQLLPRSRTRGSIYPFPHTSSRPSTQLFKDRDNFTFLLLPRIEAISEVAFTTLPTHLVDIFTTFRAQMLRTLRLP